MSLIGKFELEILADGGAFAVFAEILMPIWPDMDAAKKLILATAKDELVKLAGDTEFRIAELKNLDSENTFGRTPSKIPATHAF
jgi:hypothetical protein